MQTWSVRQVARRLVPTDPGQVRLRSAAATTTSLIIAIVALLGFTRVTGQPITVAMLGAVVAMQASAAVKDRDQRSRVITTLWLFVPSICAVTLAALLTPHGKIADVGFIVVLFAAVWVRRYGPRGNALGVIAFISYFFALFLRVSISQVPVLAVAVAVGIASSLFVRVVLFPDRPRAEARRLMSALRAASTVALDAAAAPDDGIEALRRRMDQLGETALLIDDWLDRHEAAKSLSVTSKDLARRVFEAQIMLEQSAVLLWRLGSPHRWPADVRDAVTALRTTLTNDPADDELREARRHGAASAERADLSTPEGLATVAVFRAMQAHLAIHHITTNALGVTDEAPQEEHDDSRDADEDEDSGLHPTTKTAVQVAIATSAATILGELISPDRWYWAVLTAFLVFTGVTTRGELLSRVGHRIIGTIAGVVAGVLLAAVVGQHPAVQIVVLLICVFCAFYLVTVAYVWLTFFVTVLLAMLYGLLGNFSLQVLELRIAETAAGGLVGVAAAYFVFSTKTRATFVEKVHEYLDRVQEVIDSSVDSVLAPGGETDLVAQSRQMDNALLAVITAGKPLQIGPTSDLRRGVRRLVRGLQIGNRSAHALARAGVAAAAAQQDSAPPEATADALRHAVAQTCATIAVVRTVASGEQAAASDRRSDQVIADALDMPELPPGPVRAAIRAMNTLDRTLAEVTNRV
ncbi:FUSC family protein [Mycolicibacterium chubuense]|nr:FUSC family protein [Mycolicibacterium chubuense]